jgi:hypothetical protein
LIHVCGVEVGLGESYAGNKIDKNWKFKMTDRASLSMKK